MQRDPHEAYGYDQTRRVRIAATAEEVDALDKLLVWLGDLEMDQRRILVARIMGYSWRWIMRRRKGRHRPNNRPALQDLYIGAVQKIVDRAHHAQL